MTNILELATVTKTLNRHEFLKIGGTTDTNVYYVLDGSLRLFIMDNEEEQILRLGYKNNIIAALDSYLTDKPSDIYIQAIKKTTVKVISKHIITNHISTLHNQLEWMKMLEQLALQQLEREIDLLTTSPKERYERVLRRSPELFQEIPHRYIANYLRMSAETLSRLKKS